MLKQKTLKDSFSLSGKGRTTNYRCSSRQCDGNNPWHSIVKEWSQSKYRRAWYGSPLCIGH